MKYKSLFIYILILLAGSTALASVDVGEMQLMRQGDEVVLKIHAGESFQYAHEIAEAEDGRPFRIVIDIFPAVHNFAQKNFTDLPPSIISTIRTSQYSVNPTSTVRIVLDLKSAAVYRIEKQNNWIHVYIPDDKSEVFPAWSTKKTFKTANKETKPDQLSVASKEQPKGQLPVEEPPKGDAKTSLSSAINQQRLPELTYFKPESSSILDRERIEPELVSEPLEEKSSAGESRPEKAATDLKKDDKTADTGKIDDNKEPAKSKNVEPVTKPDNQEKLKKVKKSATAEHAGTTSVEEKPAATKKAESPQEKTETVSEDKAKKSTARFRRQPTFSNKLKGTIVAEFPKRMVIKYTPGNSRDPFASLLDLEAAQNNKPTSRKIPDVETSRLVGVLESAGGQNRALLEDRDGYGYILKPGDKVKKGYVSKIYSDKALFQLFEYGWSRTVALRLNDGQ